MISFEKYISDQRRIIAILCKYRARLADARHKRKLFNELFPDSFDNERSDESLERIMPPRRQWVSLKKELRYKTTSQDNTQVISSQDANALRLQITINKAMKGMCTDSWLNELMHFVENVQKSALDPNYTISSPTTIPIRKNNDSNECRPISIFSKLQDRVLLSLANKYLTMALDPYFDEESLAFRSKRLYHEKDSHITTHHDAVDRIVEYRLKNDAKNIYVAECDMQKFYDSVSHSVIKTQYNIMIARLRKDNPEISMDAITSLFYKYLECYTFYQNVFVKNADKEFWDKHHISGGNFGWIDKELLENGICKSPKDLSQTKIGIPQGGTLSGLIANIVLNAADSKVRKIGTGNYLYLRYCDDMILMHTNKYKCKSILKQYTKALEELKLIPHTMIKSLPFRTEVFWNIKSKSVYQWGTQGSDWIGFVGYEIKRTGEIRIRKRSIKKEKTKIKSVTNEICNRIPNVKRCSNGAIKSSLQHKLISMAIGRVSLWNYKTIENELCWINGFSKLNENKYVSLQIRDLDRARLTAMRKLSKCLRSNPAKDIIRRDKRGAHVAYYGRPFSYYYHYIKNIQ